MEILKNILAIQTAFIGDSILTLPAVEKLKQIHPDYEIDVVCAPASREIFESAPYIRKVYALEKRGAHKSIFKVYKFAKQLRLNKYETVYSFHRSGRTAFLVYALKAKNNVGFSNSSLKFFYSQIIKYEKDSHETQRNLDLIGFRYSGDSWEIQPKIDSGDKIKNTIANFLKELGFKKEIIAIAPGSVWATKKYPLEYFKVIAKTLADSGYFIIALGGKEDAGLCEDLCFDLKGNSISTAGRFSIVESIELLKKCKLVLSNDSAPTHFGMCAGIPTLTLYCSTIGGFGFYPYMKNSSYLSYEDLKCKPCGIHGRKKCPVKTFDCGYKLVPDLVLRKIRDLLNESK